MVSINYIYITYMLHINFIKHNIFTHIIYLYVLYIIRITYTSYCVNGYFLCYE